MIASDTCTIVSFLEGKNGQDVSALEQALSLRQLILPPVVVTELLSGKKHDKNLELLLDSIPTIDLKKDYWVRTGKLRARLLKKGLKSRLADALIAQSCLDHHLPLITNDKDFRHYSKFAGLILIPQ